MLKEDLAKVWEAAAEAGEGEEEDPVSPLFPFLALFSLSIPHPLPVA